MINRNHVLIRVPPPLRRMGFRKSTASRLLPALLPPAIRDGGRMPNAWISPGPLFGRPVGALHLGQDIRSLLA
jgi:hypothetical protein